LIETNGFNKVQLFIGLVRVHLESETCTAPKNRGGGGAEDDISLNVVAVAATA
jgi:hypothetical protein